MKLYVRALDMWKHGRKSEVPCYVLEGKIVLQAELWELSRLLRHWVTPRRAVGPSARQADALNTAKADEARHQIASLPYLPPDWQPDDPHQRALFRKLKTS